MKFFSKKNSTGMLALGAALAMSLTACHKELFQDPVNSLSPTSAFATADRVEKAAVGMYDLLQGPDWVNAHALIMVDIRGADDNPPTYFSPVWQFSSVTSSEGYTAAAYRGAYRSIGEVNLFLKNLSASGGVVPAAKVGQYQSVR